MCCQYCRTPENHLAEHCHTLAVVWDKSVAIVDGLESRTRKLEVKNSELCSRRGCLRPHIKGGLRCAKHTKDVLQKRKVKAARKAGKTHA